MEKDIYKRINSDDYIVNPETKFKIRKDDKTIKSIIKLTNEYKRRHDIKYNPDTFFVDEKGDYYLVEFKQSYDANEEMNQLKNHIFEISGRLQEISMELERVKHSLDDDNNAKELQSYDQSILRESMGEYASTLEKEDEPTYSLKEINYAPKTNNSSNSGFFGTMAKMMGVSDVPNTGKVMGAIVGATMGGLPGAMIGSSLGGAIVKQENQTNFKDYVLVSHVKDYLDAMDRKVSWLQDLTQIPYSTLRSILLNTNAVSLENAFKISLALNMSIDVLFSYEKLNNDKE